MLGNLTFGDRRRPFTEQRKQRIPAGAISQILTFTCNGAQRLEHHAIGERRSDVGVVVRRADLDHIHSDHWKLETDPAYRIEQLTGRQSTRLGRTGARGMSWITHIDVDGE